MANFIKKVEIEGVHSRFDVVHTFNSGINILFGKNGTGKTTILHILANVLLGDFERFVYLDFKNIKLELSNKKTVQLQKKGGRIKVKINGEEHKNYIEEEVKKKDQKQKELINESATRQLPLFYEESRELNKTILPISYFPAFRTMLEAWASQRLRRDYRLVRRIPRDYAPRHIVVTNFARDLFGSFIPEINYASPIEIEYELSANIEQALIEMGRKDRELLSRAFIKILPALTQQHKSAQDDKPQDILEDIRSLLETLQESPYELESTSSDSIYTELREMINSLKLDTKSQDVAVSILSVYKELLSSRSDAQKRAFASINNYLASVNQFFENKKIALIKPQIPHRRETLIGLEFEDGTRSPLQVLSSGERQIVTMLYASTQLSKQEVVLIDEPEISLHVDWQRSLLNKMAEHLGNRQIIACTHSPVIASDYTDLMKELVLKPTKTSSPKRINTDFDNEVN